MVVGDQILISKVLWTGVVGNGKVVGMVNGRKEYHAVV
jgi:hypothetical protein